MGLEVFLQPNGGYSVEALRLTKCDYSSSDGIGGGIQFKGCSSMEAGCSCNAQSMHVSFVDSSCRASSSFLRTSVVASAAVAALAERSRDRLENRIKAHRDV